MWRTWHRRAHRRVLQSLRTPNEPTANQERMPFLSAVYGRFVAFKRARELAHAQRISPPTVPVISVGNFTFGATGKTPCVLFLADTILRHTASLVKKERDRVPLLLTRGYGDDEWRLFASKFPTCKVAIGADRLSIGSESVGHYGANLSCVLLEDGLQQWRITKDVEIVMIDALAPFGNGKLIPHGSLRERPVDALTRADIVLLHHANLIPHTQLQDLQAVIKRMTPRDRKTIVGTSEMWVVALPSMSEYDSSHNVITSSPDWHAFQGKSALIVCGVGNPESVELVVRAMGCWAHVEVEAFPDHYAFTSADFADVRARIEAMRTSTDGDVIVLTTEKDYARAVALFQSEMVDYSVHIVVGVFELRLENDAVLNRVINLLHSH